MAAGFFHTPWVEGRQASDSSACYRLHTHPTLSVGLVDAGQSRLTLGTREVELHAGDVVVINPGEVHACNPVEGKWSYRMLYFDPQWVGIAADEFVWRTPLRSRVARKVFEQLAAESRRAHTPLAALALRRTLWQLLRLAAGKRSDASTSVADSLEKIRGYIDTNCSETLRLAALASAVGVSPYTLVRRFKQRFGLTPHAYQLDQRICRGRELLKRGVPAAAVAQSLGFADQSHFLRTFRPRVAATPKQYVNRKRSAAS